MTALTRESGTMASHLDHFYRKSPPRPSSWTDDAKAELHLLGMNLHNMAVEFQCRRHPAEAAVLEGYANRIDELMKRAPEAVT